VATFHAMTLGLVRDGTDLTLRQMVILMECNLRPRTVRYLAETLNIPKPAITRAIDRLEKELGLAERRSDPDDGRSVLVGLTNSGRNFTKILVG
jgi:DNA-binding MarR family transcriptional regulator